MDDQDVNLTPSENDAPPAEHRKMNIIEEMRKLNDEMRDPQKVVFKTSSPWNQSGKTGVSKQLENTVTEILGYLQKIDASLERIEAALKSGADN